MLTGSVNHISKPAIAMQASSTRRYIDLAPLGDEETAEQNQIGIVIIDSRQLGRECFARSLAAQNDALSISTFGSVDEWRRAKAGLTGSQIILLNTGNRRITDIGIAGEVTRIINEAHPVPVVVVADTDELPQIVKALECGAKGFIPTTVSIGVASEAIELTLAGGIFVPASSLMAMRSVIDSGSASDRPMAGLFTARQMAVVEALRRGKANKIIAYELQLRESTVKVHIRNIMKKLKATNRTEVAYKIRDMFPDQAGPDI